MARALCISIFGALFLSCLIAPVVYEWLATNIEGMPWPFSRILNRVFLVLLFTFIFCYRRSFDAASIKRALRFPPSWGERVSLLVSGIVISGCTVGVCMIGVFNGGILRVNHRTELEVLWVVAGTLPIALVISVLEESFFRVMLLKRLHDFVSLPFAMVISSLSYAVVHFISPHKSFVYHGESWFQGFYYVSLMAHRLVEPGTALGISGLFVIGLLLSFAFVRIGSVYISIGLHIGWVLAIRLISFLSLRHPDVVVPRGLGGRYYLFSEPWTWFSFLLVALIIAVFPRRTTPQPAEVVA